ncbi:signal peptidase I [Peptostreptococcus porci]|nr:signal peptidase I [Peptostreptococcus porci]
MRSEKSKGLFHEIFELIKMFVMAIVLAMIIVQFIRPTRVDGLSMYPTLDNNDYLIINRISRYTGVERGSIVVFDSTMPINTTSAEKSSVSKIMDFILQDDSSTKDLVKRVIAVGGDHIVIKDGVVKVNGETLKESYMSSDNVTEGTIDTVVPEGHYFCMGDNRMRSLDSRYQEVGFVPQERLVGTVLIRLLPFSNIGKVN